MPGHWACVRTDIEHPAETAAAAFVGRHQAAVWRWLRALGCEPNRAEEHCQDALLAALHHGLDRRSDAEAATWLRTASKNLFWMRLRHERRQPPVVAIEAIEADWQRLRVDHDGGNAALTALGACLERLPARERQLVELRYRAQQDRTAMARELGIGEAGIKVALRRARARLRTCIEQRLQPEDGR